LKFDKHIHSRQSV